MKNIEELDYQEIDRKIAYQGKRVQVEEVTYEKEGKQIKREHVLSGDAVVIFNITDDQNVIMVKEARTAIGKKVLGLPAGIMEKGETKEQAAKREFEEETGYQAGTIKYLRSYYASVGYTNEKLHIFLATDLRKTQQHLDEDEDITLEWVPVKKLKELLDQKELVTASCLIACMHYFLYEQKQETGETHENK